MQLHERLMDLLGHEVSVRARADGAVKEVAAGSLKEVGPDYLIVGTTGQAGGGQAGNTVDWWIRSAKVVGIVHATDCPKCMSPD
jgi:ferredoxin-fold anticodon binding domain-containing protein